MTPPTVFLFLGEPAATLTLTSDCENGDGKL